MFIVTQGGIPHVTQALEPLRPNTLGAVREAWKHSKAFDASTRYEARPPEGFRISPLKKFLAYTIYNPSLDLEIEWEPAGASGIDEIIAEVKDGLQHDDDIIQQWFGADDVLKLLRSANNFDELCDRVECICGGFEVDERLRKIVDDVLGNEEAEQDVDPNA